MTTAQHNHIAFGKQLIRDEIEAIQSLEDELGAEFATACSILQHAKGNIIITGIGKSGHIGRKIAATLSSTGTTAYFMHPAEALHGDFGIVNNKDIIIAISYSGEASEITTLIPLIKRLDIPLIAISGNRESTIAKAAHIYLSIAVKSEACTLGLAPTSSTTKTLVLGDALAVSLLNAKGFTEHDFAFSHPGGKLGRRLLLKARDIMHTDTRLPLIASNRKIKDALFTMNEKGFGICGITDNTSNALIGVFTDGDLRRTIQKNVDIPTTVITDVMTKECKTLEPDTLLTTTISIMEQCKITAMFIISADKTPIGIVHMHDIIHLGLV